MKAYDVYKRTLSLMFEEPREDEAFYRMFPGILTNLLAESLKYENSVRKASGKNPLTASPTINFGEDEIDFCDEICAVALPYGLASYFCQDDGEGYNAIMYRERFVNALEETKKCIIENVTDEYGGDI